MTGKQYLRIIDHYESCLKQHGDNHKGVDWPNQEDANTRYQVMLDIIKQSSNPVTLLDFGCGASHLYEFIKAQKKQFIQYSGLDLSNKFITLSRTKFPSNTYYCLDILEDSSQLPEFDYIVMNGVFTEKRELSFEDMFSYFKQTILQIFPKTSVGLAFNVMSKQVDWERDDLFHLPLDCLANFLTKEVSRNFVIRNDYKLYEYTTYVYQ